MFKQKYPPEQAILGVYFIFFKQNLLTDRELKPAL